MRKNKRTRHNVIPALPATPEGSLSNDPSDGEIVTEVEWTDADIDALIAKIGFTTESAMHMDRERWH